ncbi:MAG: hypothetical protein COT81_04545 [Candidatus Buchananbacteria bacterium CG10_big_fil_rev_8_21_14_0_10_42_9]|uniref:RNA polymerase subunit sigma-24 n=1 Tax=Candidatus Buchananbacteria bacterium CG10_big_fil_rev_8_21_14_0_10_42_9 TaxID=1974526 RepID=A0A2H0W0C2_9BACT|nr:MAG: hypothetical protein COT81_04545 [Candidatus Buchananbacteria bacterium CG10_big_fil_rev_8_21_14_0_10_42_9]
MSKIKEQVLLIRAKNGDTEAFGEIYDLYVDRIYRFIFFKISSHEEAEDLTAEVFLKAWRYIQDEATRAVGNLNALLYRTARNLVIDHYRTSNREISLEAEEVLDVLDTSSQPSLLDQVEVLSEIAQLEKYLTQLKDEYREIIILRYIDELDTAEVAEIIEKSKGATRVLLHRSLAQLKKLIEDDRSKTDSKT